MTLFTPASLGRSVAFAFAVSIALPLTAAAQSARKAAPSQNGAESIAESMAVAEPEHAPGHPSAQLADKQMNGRVESLLRKMTLEEKIGQLASYSSGQATGPRQQREDDITLIQKTQVGSFLNVIGAAQTNKLQHAAVENTRLHIPLLFGYDVIHGHRTTFPVPLALASSFDPQMVEETARMAAVEARADGVDWVYSPMVDIARDARWGRIVESAGEDPFLSQAMARAYIRGYQQDDLAKPTSVAACVKHFAAYGAPVAGRDYSAVDMSVLSLRQTYLPPYRAAVDAGAATVMSSFNSLNGVPASANPFLLTQVLRREWGFDGMVASDWGAVRELLKHGVAGDGATAARKALTAGVDVDMEGDLYRTRLLGLVQSGEVPEAVVDEAVRRMLRVKFALGLFDHPYTDENAAAYSATPERRALARKAAEESFVLLKNDPVEGIGKLLPLGKTAKKVALIGPLADARQDMLGSWIASGDKDNVITLRQALQSKLGGGLTYAQGTEVLGTSDSGFAEAVNAATQADLVILALGERGDMTGEATSRAHLDLPGNQEQLLEAVAATGKPIVLVLFNGHPLAIPWAGQHVPAILEAWFPGIEAGPALADVLTGVVSPSGKLPVSLPRSVGQEPLYYAQLPTGRPAQGVDLSHPPASHEEQYNSRYIDEDNAPLFPFGWGLSYTEFRYSPLSVLHDAAGGPVGTYTVALDVLNRGSVAGTEVVQLYLRNTVASVEQPVRELKGFQRVTLAPGERKRVQFKLGFDELAFYNAELTRVVEPTDYQVLVGGSSRATNTATFTVLKPQPSASPASTSSGTR